MAHALKIELQQAVESALKEVQAAENSVAIAEAELTRVKSIPKRKAGGGKAAKTEVAKKLREARRNRQEKLDQLEVAQIKMADGLGEPSEDLEGGLQQSGVTEKRDRDGPAEETVAKKQCLTKSSGLITLEGPSYTTVNDKQLEEADPEEGGRSSDSHSGSATIASTINEDPPNVAAPHFGPSPNLDAVPASSYVTTSVPLSDLAASPGASPSFADLDKPEDGYTAGDGDLNTNKTVANDVDSEYGISDFSETDTDDDQLPNSPLYPSDTDDGSSDDDRRAYAERFTKNPEIKGDDQKMYRFLNDTDRENWIKKGRKAIKTYLAEGKEIDPSIRRMARTDPTYLPESAGISQRLAIHFLTSKDGNIQCGYHAFKNKSTFVRDGWGKVGMQIRGIPGKKKMSGGKKKKTGIRAAKDLGNCGCRIEDILLEFILSKRLKIRGMVDGLRVEEMMMGTQDYLEPRDRSFAFEAIRGLTPCFSLNDFFKHDNTDVGKAIKIAKKHVLYGLGVLNSKYKTHAMDEFVFKQIVVVSKDRLHELEAKEKRLQELDVSLAAARMDTSS